MFNFEGTARARQVLLPRNGGGGHCLPSNLNISRMLIGNKIVDYSDVVGASPVSVGPTKSSFST